MPPGTGNERSSKSVQRRFKLIMRTSTYGDPGTSEQVFHFRERQRPDMGGIRAVSPWRCKPPPWPYRQTRLRPRARLVFDSLQRASSHAKHPQDRESGEMRIAKLRLRGKHLDKVTEARRQHSRWTGIDLTPAMIDRARRFQSEKGLTNTHGRQQRQRHRRHRERCRRCKQRWLRWSVATRLHRWCREPLKTELPATWTALRSSGCDRQILRCAVSSVLRWPTSANTPSVSSCLRHAYRAAGTVIRNDASEISINCEDFFWAVRATSLLLAARYRVPSLCSSSLNLNRVAFAVARLGTRFGTALGLLEIPQEPQSQRGNMRGRTRLLIVAVSTLLVLATVSHGHASQNTSDQQRTYGQGQSGNNPNDLSVSENQNNTTNEAGAQGETPRVGNPHQPIIIRHVGWSWLLISGLIGYLLGRLTSYQRRPYGRDQDRRDRAAWSVEAAAPMNGSLRCVREIKLVGGMPHREVNGECDDATRIDPAANTQEYQERS